jgi:hypothetical protein
MPKNDEILFRVNIARAVLRTLDVRAPPGALDFTDVHSCPHQSDGTPRFFFRKTP